MFAIRSTPPTALMMQIAYSKSKSKIAVTKNGLVNFVKNGLTVKLAIEINSCLLMVFSKIKHV